MSRFLRSLFILTFSALILMIGLLFELDRLSVAIQAQATSTLPWGTEMAGKVTSRDGQQWNFSGCISDVVTIVMTSTTFSPYMELIGPTSTESVATGEVAGDTATIADHPLAASGVYTLWTGSDSRSARGDYHVAVHLAGSSTLADVVGMASYGMPVTGVITTRVGQSWGIYACAGAVVTMTLESAAFDPYLELTDATTEESLAEASSKDEAQRALIASYIITRTGLYRITALGAKLSDRGAYTLLINAKGGPTPLPSAATSVATASATKRAPATPTQIIALAPTATPTALCTVKINGLNLRSGPGTIYDPPIGNLAVGAQLRPLARDASSTWLQVQAPGNQIGWVSAGAQYVACGVTIATLPVGVIPPLPTATPTPRPTPTQQIALAPTPTPPAYFGMPGGGGGDGFDGTILAERSLIADRNNPVFRDRMYLRMEVYNTPNNRRVEHVDFIVRLQTNDGDVEVYRQSESTASYCLFGGGEPNCNVLRLQPGVTWPATNTPIVDGFYNVDVNIFVEGRRDPGNWNTFFEIDVPGQEPGGNQNEDGQNGANTPQDLVVNLAQIGPGNLDTFVTDALVFQVEAFDPSAGGSDGDGIQNVDLWVYGPGGNEVYHRAENNAHYCAFSGGEPDCELFDLQRNDRWPNDGPEIEDGQHTLRWRVNAKDGRQVEDSIGIDIGR